MKRIALMSLMPAALAAWPACQQPRSSPAATAADAESSSLWRVADGEAARRLSAVTAELAALPGHAWAGRYVMSDRPNADRLALAPTAGYVLIVGRAGACCKNAEGGRKCSPDCPGSREAVFGDVIVTPQGRLRLALELAPGNIVQAGEYVPVELGGRHYLILSDELDAFNEAVKQGDEPRKQPEGRFFLRETELQAARPALGF